MQLQTLSTQGTIYKILLNEYGTRDFGIYPICLRFNLYNVNVSTLFTTFFA